MVSSGPDWVLLRKVAIVCFVGVTLYSLAPWGQCAFHHMDAAQMDVLGEADRSGAVRADRGTTFVGGFFGSIRSCWVSYPVGDNAPWQWPAIIGSFLAIGLFGRLERMRYARQIRHMTSDYETVPRTSRRPRPEPIAPDAGTRKPAAPRMTGQGADKIPPRPEGKRDAQGRPEGKRDAPDWEWDP